MKTVFMAMKTEYMWLEKSLMIGELQTQTEWQGQVKLEIIIGKKTMKESEICAILLMVPK